MNLKTFVYLKLLNYCNNLNVLFLSTQISMMTHSESISFPFNFHLTRIDKNCAFTKKRARLWEKYSIWFMYFACLLSSEWTFLYVYICEKSIKKEEDAEDVCQLILETKKEFFLSLFSHCQLSVYFDFESPTFSWQMVCDG